MMPLFYSYLSVSVFPLISLFGIVTSSINIFILSKTKLRQNMNLYLLIYSYCDFIFISLQVPLAGIRCGALCPQSYTYEARFYETYFYMFAGYVISKYKALVDISVSIDRILLFYKKQATKNTINFRMCLLRCVLLLIAAIVIMVPHHILSKEIRPSIMYVEELAPANSTEGVILYDRFF